MKRLHSEETILAILFFALLGVAACIVFVPGVFGGCSDSQCEICGAALSEHLDMRTPAANDLYSYSPNIVIFSEPCPGSAKRSIEAGMKVCQACFQQYGSEFKEVVKSWLEKKQAENHTSRSMNQAVRLQRLRNDHEKRMKALVEEAERLEREVKELKQ